MTQFVKQNFQNRKIRKSTSKMWGRVNDFHLEISKCHLKHIFQLFLAQGPQKQIALVPFERRVQGCKEKGAISGTGPSPSDSERETVRTGPSDQPIRGLHLSSPYVSDAQHLYVKSGVRSGGRGSNAKHCVNANFS